MGAHIPVIIKAPVAQRIEQPVSTRSVGGSIPSGRAIGKDDKGVLTYIQMCEGNLIQHDRLGLCRRSHVLLVSEDDVRGGVVSVVDVDRSAY